MKTLRRQCDDCIPNLRCLGRPVSRNQAGALVLCGWAVVILNLHIAGVQLSLIPPGWL